MATRKRADGGCTIVRPKRNGNGSVGTINDFRVAKMSGGGERLRAAAPRDTLIRRLTGGSWLSHYQELSSSVAVAGREREREWRRARALAGGEKNAALLSVADLLRQVAIYGTATFGSYALVRLSRFTREPTRNN